MKKALLLALALSAGTSLAAPFVVPASWFADSPSKAKTGGELRYSSISDFKTMNPFTTTEADSLPDIMSSSADYGALFTQDPVTDKFLPAMAESMPVISNGNKRFVVKIRKGMKFSDGQAITADDFVTTWNIHSDPKVGSNHLSDLQINGKPITIKKIDDYTVQFDFPQPSAGALSRISGVAPWPDHVFGPVYKSKGAEGIKAMWGVGADPKTIVSAGPWVISSYQIGQRAVLKKNPYFGEWVKDGAGKSLPYVDTISFRIVKDLNASLAAYMAGQLDFVGVSRADDLAQVKKAIDSGNLKAQLFPNVSPNSTSSWIVFNWNKAGNPAKQKLFRDVRFRQAMSHIANRQAMIQLALGGLGTEVYSGVYPVFKNYTFDSTPKYKYDLAAASKLLSQMGYSKKNAQGYLVDASGKQLEFDLTTNAGNNVREQEARIFVDEAKKVGVKVNFNPTDFNAVIDKLDSPGTDRPWDAILLGLSGGDNIWPYGSNVVPCGTNLHSYNYTKEGGPCLTPQETLMTKLYFQGDQTLDEAARRKIGEQLSKAEALNQGYIYLVGSNYHVTFNNRVGGEYKRNLWDSYYGSRPSYGVTSYIK